AGDPGIGQITGGSRHDLTCLAHRSTHRVRGEMEATTGADGLVSDGTRDGPILPKKAQEAVETSPKMRGRRTKPPQKLVTGPGRTGARPRRPRRPTARPGPGRRRAPGPGCRT